MAKFNRVIFAMIRSDILLWSALGLVSPIFAIFITDQIRGAGVEVAGFAAAVYWILKSLLQIPVGIYCDRHPGEKDDFLFIFWGLILVGLAQFGFIFASAPWHIYFIQAIIGIGMAMVIPPWYAIFTRHIDHGREAVEWSMDSTFLGLGVGIAGALGGLAVGCFGFGIVFAVVGIFALISAFALLSVYKKMLLPDGHNRAIPPLKKPLV